MPTPSHPQIRELLLQSLVHERGGALLYAAALECAVDPALRQEWTTYLEQTLRHVDVLTGVCADLGLDPDEVTPGCGIVQHTGNALVIAIKMALAEGDPEAAQLVACDCIVLAETKDRANWELIARCAQVCEGNAAMVLQRACDEVEDDEDRHLRNAKDRCRELWLQSLDLATIDAMELDKPQGPGRQPRG